MGRQLEEGLTYIHVQMYCRVPSPYTFSTVISHSPGVARQEHFRRSFQKDRTLCRAVGFELTTYSKKYITIRP